jgi:hypothetical protein
MTENKEDIAKREVCECTGYSFKHFKDQHWGYESSKGIVEKAIEKDLRKYGYQYNSSVRYLLKISVHRSNLALIKTIEKEIRKKWMDNLRSKEYCSTAIHDCSFNERASEDSDVLEFLDMLEKEMKND